MREKSFYTAPSMEVLNFLLNEDVITTSGGGNDEPTGGFTETGTTLDFGGVEDLWG